MGRRSRFLGSPNAWSASAAHLGWYIALLASLLLFIAPGCATFAPNVADVPQVQNPFPQLSRVAVAPFFNQSDESTLDARRFSKAYFAQLQEVPGFEVVPLGVVEEAIIRHQIELSTPGEARRLAQLLGVDAVVIGSVTDYSPYTPPRCGLRVEWYAANPGFHEIPAGYGLPWDTPQEEFIPEELVYEAGMALARAQLATQTPDCTAIEQRSHLPVGSAGLSDGPAMQPPAGTALPADDAPSSTVEPPKSKELPPGPAEGDDGINGEIKAYYQQPVADENPWREFEELPAPPQSGGSGVTTDTIESSDTVDAIVESSATPPSWPDSSRFVPQALCAARPPCIPNAGPVMTHTRIYHGDDPELTEALAGYVHFRNDDRFGGWQTYLQRSDDFIRFCCHLHIAEMLTARGGGGKTRVVCEWPVSR